MRFHQLTFLYKALFAILFIILNKTVAISQTIELENAGVNAGLSFNVGSTTNRVGLYVGGFYFYNFIQINSTIRLFYNFSTFGPSKKGFELQPSFGLVGAVGKFTADENHFFSSVGNQTGRKYALGYSYNLYLDRMETSQRTGTLLIGIDKVEIISENDILAQKSVDKFRTAAAKITYRYKNMLIGATTVLWTGNPKSPFSIRKYDESFPARFGYIDFSQAPYGGFSNGVLGLQFKYAFKYGQELQLTTGTDSEKVRNFIQNRLIHDMYFWPQQWNKARNPHLPMLDSEGKAYIFKKDQKIKPSRLYMDLSLNPSIFY